MPFLQQSQNQSDGFQNLLGILRSNRERDAADLAAFHDGDRAVSRAARQRLIDHGVIEDGQTLDGMQNDTARAVADAQKTKAVENKTLGNSVPSGGYMASKMGQQGFNEQQAYANAGADAFNQTAKSAGVKFGDGTDWAKKGQAYLWDGKQYNPVSDEIADRQIRKYDVHTLENKDNTLDALRYAAQQDADKRNNAALDKFNATGKGQWAGDMSASAATAAESKRQFQNAGKDFRPVTVDKAAALRRDDADAASMAVQKVKSDSADPSKVFDAASNESGDVQYNYARGKQYIEDNMPAGPARDQAIARYSEMFKQQQLVGEKGAYMGNIYDDKHRRGGGAGEGVIAVQAQDVLKGGYSFELPKSHPTFAGFYGANKDAALESLATGLGLASVNDLPAEVRNKPPQQWKGAFAQIFQSLGTQNQGFKFRSLFDKTAYDDAIKAGASEVSARRAAVATAYANGGKDPKKTVTVSDKDASALGT